MYIVYWCILYDILGVSDAAQESDQFIPEVKYTVLVQLGHTPTQKI